MGPKLTKVACQHLQIFVAVCERTVKLRNSRFDRLKLFTATFFLGDKTVGPLMDKMRALIDRERGLVASLTFRFAAEAVQHSREAAQNSRDNLTLSQGIDSKITAVSENLSEQQRKEEVEKWKRVIAKALGFGDEYPPKIEAHSQVERLRDSLVPGTGDWLLGDDTFKSWAQLGAPPQPVLALEGPNGSGRSHLLFNVLRHLRKIHSDGGGDSGLIMSYYFHQPDARIPASRNTIPAHVLRTLLWQCCVAQEALTKSVGVICGDKGAGELEAGIDQWRHLLLDNPDIVKTGVCFVLVVDGLGDMAGALAPLLRAMQEGQSGNCFRVLLATRKDGAHSMLLPVKSMVGTIALEGRTAPDIERYIKSRLDVMEAFGDLSRPGILEWRAKIVATLRDKTSGDYVKLVKCLDDIEKVDLVEEIQNVLDNAGKSRSDQIEAEIQALNQSRTAKEIAEINEIVLWMDTARVPLPPDDLDAVLAVGQSSDGGSSLLPLEARLRAKYTLFAVSTAGKVEYRSPEVQQCIPRRDQVDGADYQTGSGPPNEIYPSEVGMVKHFLRTVCPKEVYDKFGFDQFLETKMHSARNYICADPDNSEARMAVTCLRILTEPRNLKTAKLHPYAAQFLFSHLRKTDLSLADRELKAQAGHLLYKLFNSDFGIDSMFWAANHGWLHYSDWLAEVDAWAKEVRAAWIYSYRGPTELVRWLKDTAVFRGVPEGDGRQWAGDLVQEEGIKVLEILYRHAAKRMAEHLLRAFWTDELHTAIAFLTGYLERVSIQTPAMCQTKSRHLNNSVLSLQASVAAGREPSTTQGDWREDVPRDIKTIHRAISASRDLVEETFPDVFWSFLYAEIPSRFIWANPKLTQTRKERAREALLANPRDCLAMFALSVTTDSNDRESVIRSLEAGLDLLHDGWDWRQTTRTQRIYSALFEMLVTNYIDSQTDENFSLAVAAVRECLQDRLQVGRAVYHLLLLTVIEADEKERWDDILALVETSNQYRDSWETYSLLLDEAYSYTRFNEAVIRAADARARGDIVDAIYQPAIEIAAGRKEEDHLCWLRYSYAFALNFQPGNQQRVLGLWEQMMDRFPKLTKAPEVLVMLIQQFVAPNYVLNALEADPGSETANRHLARIRTMQTEPSNSDEQTTWTPNTSRVSLFIARYHWLNGSPERARKEVAAMMKSYLAQLEGARNFWSVCAVCAACDDDENAIAAFHMILRDWHGELDNYEEEKSKWDEKHGGDVATGPWAVREEAGDEARENAETTVEAMASDAAQTIEDEPKPSPPRFPCACDGCDDPMPGANVWWCRLCAALRQYDDKCYRKIIDGTMGKQLCPKEHGFLRIPGLDPNSPDAALPVGSIRVGTQIMTLEEWVNSLAATYLGFKVA